MNEFELIKRYFVRAATHSEVQLGNGDDCALLAPRAGYSLAISTDLLVQGRHFLPDVDPFALGVKALAVNLSDLAAMGAEPLAFTLALALPNVNEAWLERFATGLFHTAQIHQIDLIGGDTTRCAPDGLTIGITVMGQTPIGQAVTRAGARVGDEIWVSGSLGGAALGLQCRLGHMQLAPAMSNEVIQLLEQPTPRNALGIALRGIATAMLDLSDGLAGDLLHILLASAVHGSALQAQIDVSRLPMHRAVSALAPQQAYHYALSGGDDYELCFTAPQHLHVQVLQQAQSVGVPVTCVGKVVQASGERVQLIQWLDHAGQAVALRPRGYDHFESTHDGSTPLKM